MFATRAAWAKLSAARLGGCPFASIIKATAGAVAPNVPAIVDDFYPRMFRQNPEVKPFFNPANQFADPPLQHRALANAVVAYASNIDDLTPLHDAVELIVHKHCGLTVLPEHYPVVHKNLMESIGHVLGDVVTPEIGQGWSDAVLALAELLYKREEEVYKAAESRRGGWRGMKDFKVARKRQVAEGSVEITFEPVEGSGPIDFTPGQFLTLHMKQEGATPRHYTVTNKPGEPYLQCCVKILKDGFVSNALHQVSEGTIVGLAPPFGKFAVQEASPMVLVSAGIGVTPMKSFLEASPEKVRLAMHIDRNRATHPFKTEFSAVPSHFHYTEESGRPAPKALVDGVLKPHLADCDFYLCGPPAWLDGLQAALVEGGAKGVHAERFGPALS